MINPQWLELPMSRTIFYGPKDVRAIEVRLYNIKRNGVNIRAKKKTKKNGIPNLSNISKISQENEI